MLDPWLRERRRDRGCLRVLWPPPPPPPRRGAPPLDSSQESITHGASVLLLKEAQRRGTRVVEWQRGCRLGSPAGGLTFWTFSVNRADGHFAFCLFDFSSVGECYVQKKKKREKLRAPVCAMCLMLKMGTTWQRGLAFVSIFFFLLNLFFLQLCVSLGEIKINAHNLRVKTKTKKTAKYTHCPRLLK